MSRINLSRCINDTLHSLLQIPLSCQCLMFQFLIHNRVRILLFILSIFLLMTFILILINLLPFEKAKGVVLHIFYIILCLMLIFHSFVYSHSIPKSVSEVVSNSGQKFAMKEEMVALEQNDTWDLASLLPSKKAVGCRWV